jgi:hypothetical protein
MTISKPANNKKATPEVNTADIIELGAIKEKTEGYEFSGATERTSNEYKEYDS